MSEDRKEGPLTRLLITEADREADHDYADRETRSLCGTSTGRTGWYCTRTEGHAGPCAAHPVYSPRVAAGQIAEALSAQIAASPPLSIPGGERDQGSEIEHSTGLAGMPVTRSVPRRTEPPPWEVEEDPAKEVRVTVPPGMSRGEALVRVAGALSGHVFTAPDAKVEAYLVPAEPGTAQPCGRVHETGADCGGCTARALEGERESEVEPYVDDDAENALCLVARDVGIEWSEPLTMAEVGQRIRAKLKERLGEEARWSAVHTEAIGAAATSALDEALRQIGGALGLDADTPVQSLGWILRALAERQRTADLRERDLAEARRVIDRLRAQLGVLSEASIAQELQRANGQLASYRVVDAEVRKIIADARTEYLRRGPITPPLPEGAEGWPLDRIARTLGQAYDAAARAGLAAVERLEAVERAHQDRLQAVDADRREAGEQHLGAMRDLAVVAGFPEGLEITFDSLHSWLQTNGVRSEVARLHVCAALGEHAASYPGTWPGVIECVGDVVRGHAAWSARAQRAEGELAKAHAAYHRSEATRAEEVTDLNARLEVARAAWAKVEAALGVSGGAERLAGVIARLRVQYKEDGAALEDLRFETVRRLDALERRAERLEGAMSPTIRAGVAGDDPDRAVQGIARRLDRHTVNGIDVPNGEDAAAFLARLGTDGAAWAKAFADRFAGWTYGNRPVLWADEGDLIAWFANAIEAGRTAGRVEHGPDDADDD